MLPEIGLKDKIVTLHNEIGGNLKLCVAKAIEIGGLLTQQKESLPHGEWLSWVEDNLPFSDRTARNYMNLYENRDRLKSETVSDLTSAYRLLAPPKADHESQVDTLMQQANDLLKQACDAQQEELKDPDLPIEYWNQCKVAAEKTVQEARGFALDAERRLGEVLIEQEKPPLVPWGCKAHAFGHSSALNYWSVFFFPSTNEGFFWVSMVSSEGGDSGGVMEYTRKPIRGSAIKKALEIWRVPVHEMELEISETDERFDHDPLVFSNHDEWFKECILGKGD